MEYSTPHHSGEALSKFIYQKVQIDFPYFDIFTIIVLRTLHFGTCDVIHVIENHIC